MAGTAITSFGQTSAQQLEVVKESLACLALRVNRRQWSLLTRNGHHHQTTDYSYHPNWTTTQGDISLYSPLEVFLYISKSTLKA